MRRESAPVSRRSVLSSRADAATLIRAASLLIVVALLASRADYVPMWDGRVYADCIVDATLKPLSLEALRCGGHASHVYIAFMVLVQSIAPTSYLPMLAANTILLVAASIAFERILRLAFPSDDYKVDRALLTAAFLLVPAILASVVQPGIDFPLVPGLLWAMAFLLERKLLAATAVGVAMAFTKETGVLLFGVLVASYALWFPLHEPGSIRSRLLGVLRLAPLASPFVVFGSYVLYRSRVGPAGGSLIWNATTIGEPFLHHLLVPRLDLYLINYLVIGLILSFAWIPTAFITLDGFVGTVRKAHRLPKRALPGAKRDVVGFLLLFTVATAYALTRFATFGNSRYLVTLMALLLLPFMGALVRLGLPGGPRRAVLATFAVALLVSTVRTVDPVSRWVYGTFPVGRNSMLHMTAITDECCGLGRDQLAYNLEFTSLDALTQRALMTLPGIDSTTALVVPDSTNWSTIGPLDARTRRRTLGRRGTLTPEVIEPRDVVSGASRPQRLYYLALPYASAARGAGDLARFYEQGEVRRFESGGYTLPVYPYTTRGAPQP